MAGSVRRSSFSRADSRCLLGAFVFLVDQSLEVADVAVRIKQAGILTVYQLQ